jgi:hypothetical protein
MVWVAEDGLKNDDKKIYVKAFGESANNGEVQLFGFRLVDWAQRNGKAVMLSKSDFTNQNPYAPANTAMIAHLWVRGKVDSNGKAYQTAVGSAGQLRLAVVSTAGETIIEHGVKSEGFSVAAIPMAVRMEVVSAVQGGLDRNNMATFAFAPNPADTSIGRFLYGIRYKIITTSDSGVTTDLDMVEMTERVTGRANGFFRGPIAASKFRSVLKSEYDDHGTLTSNVPIGQATHDQ